MPIYIYECPACWRIDERVIAMADRDEPQQCECGATLTRKLTSAAFRMPGGNPKINYADQFTADALGMPLRDLPDSLRTKKV